MRAYLPAYDVVTPRTLDEALALKAAEGAALTPLAGGTDVMVLLEAGELRAKRLLNVWGLDALRGVTVADDAVTLGALTTYREIQASATLAADYPILTSAARLTGAVAIQNRGTIGGNVANASPAADSPPGLLAYGAEIELVSAAGRRRVPYDGFHTGYKQTVMRPDELVLAVRLPRRQPAGREVHYFRKVGTRRAQAISKVVMAAWADVVDGRVAACRVAIGSVAPTVLRMPGLEAALLGAAPGPELVAKARAAAEADVRPIDDIRSTAEYRRVVAGNLAGELVGRLAG